MVIAKVWRNWRTGLIVVQPDMVVRWHRHGPVAVGANAQRERARAARARLPPFGHSSVGTIANEANDVGASRLRPWLARSGGVVSHLSDHNADPPDDWTRHHAQSDQSKGENPDCFTQPSGVTGFRRNEASTNH